MLSLLYYNQMAVLFHFFFELVRVGVLSLLYGFIIWFLVTKALKLTSIKKRFLVPSLFVILFIWRFSYWRDNGLGDFGRVPLSSNYVVEIIDWSWVRIKKNGESVNNRSDFQDIEELYFEKGILYAQLRKGYLILNSSNDKIHHPINKEKFMSLGGDLNKLRTPDRFHSGYWGWGLLFF
ncbi:hypothetical protein ACFSRZ_03635 [Pseudotenacibaculum haliotis]|uniref:Uncharacterized protein n=2 Tax=Pseudotenacibaculum haliotis TaxID=1862138 RepID=A0ABW5LNN5_9FLAO